MKVHSAHPSSAGKVKQEEAVVCGALWVLSLSLEEDKSDGPCILYESESRIGGEDCTASSFRKIPHCSHVLHGDIVENGNNYNGWSNPLCLCHPMTNPQ